MRLDKIEVIGYKIGNLITPDVLVSITDRANWRHENKRKEIENNKVMVLTERCFSIYNQL